MTHAIWLTMPINDDIRSQTESFVADVTALIRRAALDAVRAALASGQGAAAAVKAVAAAKKAAPAAKAAPAKKAAPAPAKKAAKAAPKAAPKKAAKRPVGAKRPPAELAALVEKLAGYIKSNPGQGAEAIGKALGLPTSEMTLPIKKLLSAKRIRSEGQKRATKYFPG